MITLISRWKLRNGCPPELHKALQMVAEQVKACEPGTLMYSVHLPALSPLDTSLQPHQPPLPFIAMEQQTEVVFVEIYKDADAFTRHVNGATFTRFRKRNIRHFYEDPVKPGWPVTITQFLDRQSAFIRNAATDCQPG